MWLKSKDQGPGTSHLSEGPLWTCVSTAAAIGSPARRPAGKEAAQTPGSAKANGLRGRQLQQILGLLLRGLRPERPCPKIPISVEENRGNSCVTCWTGIRLCFIHLSAPLRFDDFVQRRSTARKRCGARSSGTEGYKLGRLSVRIMQLATRACGWM